MLIIIVQHIQSPHAREKIKLIKYATHFRDGHAPTPNYTNHHSTVVPAPIARPAHDDYGGSQQLEVIPITRKIGFLRFHIDTYYAFDLGQQKCRPVYRAHMSRVTYEVACTVRCAP